MIVTGSSRLVTLGGSGGEDLSRQALNEGMAVTRFLLAVCASITVGSIAGLAHLLRWLNNNTTVVPDTVPEAWSEIEAL